MACGGRTSAEIARLRVRAVRSVLAGVTPAEASVSLGVSERQIHRWLRAWREARGLSTKQLYEMRMNARLAREEVKP